MLTFDLLAPGLTLLGAGCPVCLQLLETRTACVAPGCRGRDPDPAVAAGEGRGRGRFDTGFRNRHDGLRPGDGEPRNGSPLDLHPQG